MTQRKIILISIVIIVVALSTSVFLFQPNIEEESISISHADKIISECKISIDCVIDSLRALEKTEEKSVIIATFHDLVSNYEESVNYCHSYAHHLSRYLMVYVGDVTETISYLDRKCGGSLFHGVVEQYFISQQLNKVDPAEIEINSICPENQKNPYDVKKLECIHGIGHGLYIIYHSDVFEAVERCDVFDAGWEQDRCAAGIFMENQVVFYEDEEGDFKEDDLLYPCNQIDSKYAPACYGFQAYYIIQNKLNVSRSIPECDKIIPEEFVKFCYAGIGGQMSRIVFDNLTKSFEICSNGQPQYQKYCFTGIAFAIADHRGIDRTFEYCKIVPEFAKYDCYNELGKWIAMFDITTDARSEQCSKAENDEYYQICINADVSATRFV